MWKQLLPSNGNNPQRRVAVGVLQLSGLGLMPVSTRMLLLALGFVFVQRLRRLRSRALGLVVLPRVPLAPAGGDHRDLVRPRAAVLALQPDALGAGLVVHAPPVVVAAPASPELPAVGAADPVVEHLGREALAGAHQLLDGVDAGAVAVGDVLGGPELPAADLTAICGGTEGTE